MDCLAPNIDFNNKGDSCVRLHCVMCCYKCTNCVTQTLIRLGRVTSKFCPICKVVLCQHCFVIFHTTSQLSVPECVLTKVITKKGKKCKPLCSPKISDKKLMFLPSPFVRKWKIIGVNTPLATQIRNLSPRLSKKRKKCSDIDDNINDCVADSKIRFSPHGDSVKY